MRHLAIFLTFYASVAVFYLLCKHQFRSWKMGLLGSLMLILHPRIFAHSFYNSKDLVFLSFFIISMFSLVRYLDRKTLGRAAVHALFCAILINVRVLGVLVPFLTLVALEMDYIWPGKSHSPAEKRMVVRSVLTYIALLIFLTILFWPRLWSDPIMNFIKALLVLGKFPLSFHLLYFGQLILSTKLPWHYIPVLILITTPIAYTFFFSIGAADALRNLSQDGTQRRENRNTVLFLLWFFLPLLAVIVLQSTLYDNWRHLYFVYPALVLLALGGIRATFAEVRTWKPKKLAKRTQWGLLAFLVASFVSTAAFMIRNHPHENVYFNASIIGGTRGAETLFEFDIWGTLYREALEYILKEDGSPQVRVFVPTQPGWNNHLLLPAEGRQRLEFVKEEEAEYFILYRYVSVSPQQMHEKYSVTVDGVKIMSVYQKQ